tara:strand:+ start:192 stop:908 length:717 start_codon:yes stop_codon:yes gene_type:complete
MKHILIIFFSLSFSYSFAQVKLLKSVSKKANNLIHGEQGLTESQISEGIIEALIQGSRKAVNKASLKDGFNNNSLIRIPFPEEAQNMKKVLVKTGFSKKVVQFEKSMNLAAEKASKEALNILLDAIKSITIHDAFSILKGDDNSATKYLKNNTSNLLYNKFNPIVKNAIKSVNVTNYWKELVGIYNTIPLTKPVNPNLEEYVTNKAIDGLFVLISQEETNIRNHPEYRVSDLLRRVFK